MVYLDLLYFYAMFSKLETVLLYSPNFKMYLFFKLFFIYLIFFVNAKF